jgi:hypothetical protein
MDPSSPADEAVVPVDVPWRPARGAATPVLFQDDDLAVLIFEAAKISSAPTGVINSLKRSVSPAVAAVSGPGQPARVELRFDDCLATKFGRPGAAAETVSGEGLFEVLNSSWPTRLHHSGAAPADPAWLTPPRHFVVAFGNMTFECLCGSVRGRATDLAVGQILASLTR